MLALARSSENRLAVLSLAQVEFRSAIRRRERNGEIPSSVSAQLLDSYRRHSESRFITQPVSDFLLDIALELIDRHGLRAFDAMQLAGYEVLKRSSKAEVPYFVCADRQLLAAAEEGGASILNPSP